MMEEEKKKKTQTRVPTSHFCVVQGRLRYDVLWCVDALVHSASAQRSDSCGDMFSLRPLWREERQSPEGRRCNFSFVGESVCMRHRNQKIRKCPFSCLFSSLSPTRKN